MTIIEIKKTMANIQLDFDEVMVFNNALNEVCHGFHISDFSTRMGAHLHEVEALLKQVNKTYNTMREFKDSES